MKRSRLPLLLLMCLVASVATWAGPVNENQAIDIASRFMASHAKGTAPLKLARKGLKPGTLNSGQDKVAYYVFNSTDSRGGYVIVSGDDRTAAVLGYSDRGAIEGATMPVALAQLLDSYAEQIEALDQDAQIATHLTTQRSISPLLPAVWSQNSPFNKLLPLLSSGAHAYAGCVATALAQVMHYHQWPARSTAIPGYTSKTLSFTMPDLPPTTFDWGSMHNTYLTDDTLSAAGIAAAQLTLYCAQALQADFKTSSTSAYSSDIPSVVTSYFGYKGTAKYLRRPLYSSQQWESIIYNELLAARPVIYSGSKLTGGHAFVCDGYDGNGLFHINWGWNGQSNGYFLLNVLNPAQQGTGSASGTYGYLLSQAIIVGIEPGDEPTNDFTVTSSHIEILDYNGTRNSTSDDFSLQVLTHFNNYTTQTISFDYAWGFYDQNNTLLMALNTGSKSNLASNYYIYPTRTLQFGAGITSGTYRIVPIYSEYKTTDWRPCEAADINYIEVTINGNSCTVRGNGTAATASYTVNSIHSTGNMHPNRPVDITLNMTNNGGTRNDLIYMINTSSGNAVASVGYIDIARGQATDVPFKFMPQAAGTYHLAFSLNEDGSDPIATHTLVINEMPAASLQATAQALNVTDAGNRIITSDKFSVLLTITNNGSTTYNEDISIKLYKITHGTTGSNIQAKSQQVNIAPGQTTTVQFDMENVTDGWRYFAKTYYYSSGQEKALASISSHTIVFPEVPDFQPGDVNDDHAIDIEDVTHMIAYILNGEPINTLAGDLNDDQSIDIEDVTLLIQMILGN